MKKILNILLVDDTWANMMALEHIFSTFKKAYQINILTANDGHKGVKVFKDNNITLSDKNVHLVIMDFNMVKMHGNAAC